MKRFYVVAVILLLGVGLLPGRPEEMTPQQVFEKRLLPIFKSPDPSSCVQCHLSGVDLKAYIRPSCEQTFAALRDQGLIDLEKPEKSRILALIQMGEKDAGASLLHKKARQAERDAFADWIRRSAADPKLRALPVSAEDQRGGPSRPVEVIRHGRTDRLTETFTNTIWALRFRCMSCHIEGTAENKKLVDKHGDGVAWFKTGGPEATLAYLRSSKLIDVKNPEKSLLLLKPLGVVEHGGGIKILPGDQGYRMFRTFVEDYARIVRDEYADAAALPKKTPEPRRFGSDIWFKLTNTPAEWGERLLQVEIFAWDAAKNAWEPTPIATTDRPVAKARLWQHNLTLLAEPGSERAKGWSQAAKPTLPRGRFLVKVWVDSSERLAKDWKATFGDAEYMGQVEVQSAWPAGYCQMTAAEATRIRK